MTEPIDFLNEGAEAAVKQLVAEVADLHTLAKLGQLVRRMPEILEHHNYGNKVHLCFSQDHGWHLLITADPEDLSGATTICGIWPKISDPREALQGAIDSIEDDIEEARSFFDDDDDASDCQSSGE